MNHGIEIEQLNRVIAAEKTSSKRDCLGHGHTESGKEDSLLDNDDEFTTFLQEVELESKQETMKQVSKQALMK